MNLNQAEPSQANFRDQANSVWIQPYFHDSVIVYQSNSENLKNKKYQYLSKGKI